MQPFLRGEDFGVLMRKRRDADIEDVQVLRVQHPPVVGVSFPPELLHGRSDALLRHIAEGRNFHPFHGREGRKMAVGRNAPCPHESHFDHGITFLLSRQQAAVSFNDTSCCAKNQTSLKRPGAR